VVVGFELVMLAWLRYRFFETSFVRSFATVTVGGAAIAAVSAAVGSA
jgi:erythrin-vacuolar iron transport family protein